MKQIKETNVLTKEGFSFKNLSRFPSYEWGDDGGLDVDLYYKGERFAHVYNDGNGGCPMVNYYGDNINLIKCDALAFLKRYDYSYSPLSQYEWLKNKSPYDINDDDIENLACCLEVAHEDLEIVEDLHKKTKRNTFMAICDDYERIVVALPKEWDSVYQHYDNDIMRDRIAKALVKQNNTTLKDNVKGLFIDRNSGLI